MIRAGAVGGAAIGLLVALFMMIGGGGGGGGSADLVAKPVDAKVLSPGVKFRQGGGAAAELGTGDALNEGVVIETDETGLAEFRYADDSLLRVGPGSNYTLDKTRATSNARDIVGKLATGKTWHVVTPKDADYAIRVTGATGTVVGTTVSVVCATEFDCAYTVIRGRLEVDAESEQEAELEAGDQVQVKFGRLDPVRRLTAEEMAADPWIAQNLNLDGEIVEVPPETTTTLEGETTTTLEGVPGETTVPGRTGTTRTVTTRDNGGGTPPGTSPPPPPPPPPGTQPTTATTSAPTTTSPPTTAAPTTTTKRCDQKPKPDNCPP